MALTVQNVASPPFDPSGTFRTALDSFNRGMESAKSGISAYDTARQSAADKALNERLTLLDKPEDITTAMRSGLLTEGLGNISKEGMDSISKRAAALTELGVKQLHAESYGQQIKNQASKFKEEERNRDFLNQNSAAINRMYERAHSGDISGAVSLMGSLQDAPPDIMSQLSKDLDRVRASQLTSRRQGLELSDYEKNRAIQNNLNRSLADITSQTTDTASQQRAQQIYENTGDPQEKLALGQAINSMFPNLVGPIQTQFGQTNLGGIDLTNASPQQQEFATNLESNRDNPVALANIAKTTQQGITEQRAFIESKSIPYATMMSSLSNDATPTAVAKELENESYGYSTIWPFKSTNRSDIIGLVKNLAHAADVPYKTAGKLLAYAVEESSTLGINWGKGITYNQAQFDQLAKDFKNGKVSLIQQSSQNLANVSNQINDTQKIYEDIHTRRINLEKTGSDKKRREALPALRQQEELAFSNYTAALHKGNESGNQPNYGDAPISSVPASYFNPPAQYDGRQVARGKVTPQTSVSRLLEEATRRMSP